MKLEFGKCDAIALAFFTLLSALEVWALFSCFAENHQHMLNLVRIVVFVTMFNTGVVWFTLKYKTIKDKIKNKTE